VINVHHSARAPCRGLFSEQPSSGTGRTVAGRAASDIIVLQRE
jgi:hypothetical protein